MFWCQGRRKAIWVSYFFPKRLGFWVTFRPEAKPQIQNKPAVKKSEPSKDRGAMFDSRDKDKDGKLTKEEFLANQPDPDEAPKRFPRFDSDSNGSLSREEFIKGGKK